MSSDQDELEGGEETGSVRVVRAVTWASIFAAAALFWAAVGWLFIAYVWP